MRTFACGIDRAQLDASDISRRWHALTIIKDIDIKASTAIKVASPKLDDQVEAEWLPFSGISYEPNDDAIVIVLEGTTV